MPRASQYFCSVSIIGLTDDMLYIWFTAVWQALLPIGVCKAKYEHIPINKSPMPIRIHPCMDQNQVKNFRKWVKMCKKLNLLHAKMGEWEYSAEVKAPKASRSLTKAKNDGKIEGLVHDPAAAMPSDGDLLYYSTESFDQMLSGRKEIKARNEV